MSARGSRCSTAALTPSQTLPEPPAGAVTGMDAPGERAGRPALALLLAATSGGALLARTLRRGHAGRGGERGSRRERALGQRGRVRVAAGAALGACVAVTACGRDPAPTPPVASSGEVQVAAPKAPAPRARCPEAMAEVEGYCVDRWEATLVQDDSGAAHSPFQRLQRGVTYRAVSRPGVTPQGYISRLDAARACTQAGKRLCRAREWLSACLAGGASRAWEARCNLEKAHVMTAVFGTRVVLTYDAHYNSPRLNQEPGFLALTGGTPGCVNARGLFDMVGNLHEWVADDVSARLKREIPIPYDDSLLGPRGNGVFMGGFYSSHGEHGRGCNYVTTSHKPDYHDYSTGFRCCADAR